MSFHITEKERIPLVKLGTNPNQTFRTFSELGGNSSNLVSIWDPGDQANHFLYHLAPFCAPCSLWRVRRSTGILASNGKDRVYLSTNWTSNIWRSLGNLKGCIEKLLSIHRMNVLPRRVVVNRIIVTIPQIGMYLVLLMAN